MTAKAIRIKIKVGKHPTAAPGVEYTPPKIPWRRAENARQRAIIAVGVSLALGAVVGLFALLLVNEDDALPPAEFANAEPALPLLSDALVAQEPAAVGINTTQADPPAHALAEINTESFPTTQRVPETENASTALLPDGIATERQSSIPNAGPNIQSATPSTSRSAEARPANEKISSKNIFRTQLATRREGLEPANTIDDKVKARDRGAVRVYYFNELHGLKGRTVTHQWIHNGKVYANVEAEVKGNAWRMYSSKALNSSMTGEWKINVTDELGNTLATRSFSYEK